jgi:hypothetical protein
MNTIQIQMEIATLILIWVSVLLAIMCVIGVCILTIKEIRHSKENLSKDKGNQSLLDYKSNTDIQ